MTRGGCVTTRGSMIRQSARVGPPRETAKTRPLRDILSVWKGFSNGSGNRRSLGPNGVCGFRLVRVLARTSRVDAVVEVDLHALLDALEVRAGENTGLDGGLGRRRIGGGRHRRDVGRHLRRYALSGRTQKRSSASNASQKRSVFSIGFLVSWVVSWACVRAADQGGWRGVSSEREGRKVVDQTRGRARGGRAGRTSAYPATYLAVPPGRRSAAIRASGGSKRSVLRAKGLLSLSILSLGIASLMSSFCGAVVSGAQGASVVGGRLLWAERGVCRCGVLA